MLIAVPMENKNLHEPVCPSFGRAPLFLLHNTADGMSRFVDNPAAAAQGGAGIKAAQALVDNNVNVLLTPRCGENAAKILEAADIALFKTDSGSADEQIKRYMDKKLPPLTEIHAGFHKHG